MFPVQPLDSPEADQEPVFLLMFLQYRVYVSVEPMRKAYHRPLVSLVEGIPPMDAGDIAAGKQLLDDHVLM
jgi:hypothetical protein